MVFYCEMEKMIVEHQLNPEKMTLFQVFSG